MLLKKYDEHDSEQDKQMKRVFLWYGMLCYASNAMVWYGKYGMLWDFNAMLWDFYAMLWYGLCCKR